MPHGKQWLWISGIMGATFALLLLVGALLPEPDNTKPAAATTKPTRTVAQPTRLPTYASGCEPDDAKATLDKINPIAVEFSDAFDRAGASSRIALDGPISSMQEARREVEQVKLPRCGEALRRVLHDGYQAAIDAFIAFQSQRDASARFEDASELLRTAAKMINDLTADAY